MMEWFILSLLTALAAASQDAWVKKFFSTYNAYEMAVLPMIFSLPLLIFAVFFIEVPKLDATFTICFLLSLPLNALCLVCYMTAIKTSPLSLTLPYLAFSPVFMILTGFLFLGERPEISGVVGIIAICTGAYILNLGNDLKHFFSPFKAIIKEKGSRLMLGVALLFSILAPIGKKAIIHSSPAFFSYTFFIALTFFLTVCFFNKINYKNIFQQPLKGVVAGVFLFCHIIFHGFAVSMVNVTYMISIKRLSIIFGIIYGRLFFGEKNTIIRMIGALIMIAGAVLITLS